MKVSAGGLAKSALGVYVTVVLVNVAPPLAGWVTPTTVSPWPVSLARTLMVTGVPAGVASSSSLAIIGGGVTVTVTVAVAVWPKASRTA